MAHRRHLAWLHTYNWHEPEYLPRQGPWTKSTDEQVHDAVPHPSVGPPARCVRVVKIDETPLQCIVEGRSGRGKRFDGEVGLFLVRELVGLVVVGFWVGIELKCRFSEQVWMIDGRCCDPGISFLVSHSSSQ